ncbi:MAG: N-acetyltransferase family protein [Tepidiformaceae bacterium]
MDIVVVRHATRADLPAINGIYNEEVLRGTATWDYEPWTAEQREHWFDEHEADPSQPVLVAQVGQHVAGFAYLSYYRTKVGYRFTRENTVYIDAGQRRRGIARLLMERLLAEARAHDIHAVVAVIAGENQPSIELHAGLGFEVAGTMREVGYKFDRWLDLTQMVVRLD